MALAMNKAAPIGLLVTNAYLRVEAVLISHDSMDFRLRCYIAPTGVPAFSDEGFSCVYDMAGQNPFEQAYVYLKTLPEFSGAADA